MGFIHKLTPDHFVASGPHAAFGNSEVIFGQVSDGMHFSSLLCVKKKCHILYTVQENGKVYSLGQTLSNAVCSK